MPSALIKPVFQSDGLPQTSSKSMSDASTEEYNEALRSCKHIPAFFVGLTADGNSLKDGC